MKPLNLVLLVFLFMITGYTQNILSSNNIYEPDSEEEEIDLSKLLSLDRLKSNTKLKEGLINWLKDQIDPEMITTWYNMSFADKKCVILGLSYSTKKIQGQTREDARKVLTKYAKQYIELFCPSTFKVAEKIYDRFMEEVNNLEERYVEWLKELPDSIREPLEKMRYNHLTRVITTGQPKDLNKYVIMYSELKRILNASIEDREMLAKKVPFLTPYVIGDLGETTLRLFHLVHKYIENNEHVDPVEYLLVLKNWIEGTIEALENYFESRPKSENNLPADINRQFNADLSMLYDMATEYIMGEINDDSDELDFSSESEEISYI